MACKFGAFLRSTCIKMDEESAQVKKGCRKSRKVEKDWDDDDTKKLIESVEVLMHIWNPTNVFYKDNRKKEASFDEIGSTMNRSGTDCKAKWDNLRVQYRM